MAILHLRSRKLLAANGARKGALNHCRRRRVGALARVGAASRSVSGGALAAVSLATVGGLLLAVVGASAFAPWRGRGVAAVVVIGGIFVPEVHPLRVRHAAAADIPDVAAVDAQLARRLACGCIPGARGGDERGSHHNLAT